MKNKTTGQEGPAEAQDKSLADILLSKSAKVKKKDKKADETMDAELDGIFKSSAGVAKLVAPVAPAVRAQESTGPKSTKRKQEEPSPSAREGKRRKSDASSTSPASIPKTSAISKVSTVKSSKKSKRHPAPQEKSDESSGDDSDAADLEDAYIARSVAVKPKQKSSKPIPKAGSHPPEEATAAAPTDDDPSDSHDESGDEANAGPIVHESLQAGSSKARPSKKKYVPEDETKAQRDARTIFIGNLPIEAAKSKSALKGLQRLITTHAPGAKIESTRFRSVAFKNPTAEMPKSDDEGDQPSSKTEAKTKKSSTPTEPSTKQVRQHQRASEWRAREDADAEKPGSGKVFLNPAEKKRIAFIKGEFHDGVDTIHAYVVFAHPDPARSVHVPVVLDPYEAAKTAVEKCDGMIYMERTLRVDHVSSSSSDAAPHGGPGRLDTRRTAFVGNLDFQSKEQDVRAFFEALVTAERGPPSEESADDATSNTPSTWVSHVRIVRDQETQLGKGFAYVEFKDRECLDEVLALEQDKVRFAKRKLRVQRCKTAPAPKQAKSAKPVASTSSKPVADLRGASSKPTPIQIPKGDPMLGERLRGLDKDARRAAKSSDADRVARRLAKKKARNALDRAGVPTSSKDKKSSTGLLGVTKKRGGAAKSKAKVSRIRSEKSVAKRNAKK